MTRYLLTLSIALLIAISAAAAFADDHDQGVRHYLSLGTSLAAGVQPDAQGVNRRTDDGYANQLFDIVEPEFRKLKLTKLGCPGETTVTMVEGGICGYEKGTQLAEAVEFLHAHKHKVALVTIDMGVNDILAANCIDPVSNLVNQGCLLDAFNTVSVKLAEILSAITAVAHPDTKIVAMNYYNTFLAAWSNGADGQALAYDSALLAAYFNGVVLGGTYAAFGIPVADVAAAFDSNNFDASTVHGVPVNVLNICLYTYMCARPPVGPDIHANPAGYAMIAATIASEL